MRRSFGVDTLACPRRGGRMRLVATIDRQAMIDRILRHLGLRTDLPIPRPARALPLGDAVRGAAFNRRIRLRSLAGVWRVVGICADGRYSSSAGAGEAVVYLPFYQRPFSFARRKILVSVDGRWSRIASPVTDMIKARGLVAASTSSLSQLLEHRLARINLALYVLGIAAGASLLVTWGSLLGAVRYIVGRERRNIALRMAIGGRPAGIAWAYFGRLLGPVVVGGLAAVLLSGIVYPIVQRIAEADRTITLAFAGMLAAGTCAAASILLVAAIRNVGEGELAPVLREE